MLLLLLLFLLLLVIDSGTVRLCNRAQMIAKECLINFNRCEGIWMDNESKLWFDNCNMIGSVGAGIHINPGCKCLLTNCNISCCGDQAVDIPPCQGAITIYGLCVFIF